MRDHFDTIAWMAGLGSWLLSVGILYFGTVFYGFNPLWLGASFFAPCITVAAIYAMRLRKVPKMVRQLGDLDKEKRRKAFEQLMAMGDGATDAFLQVLGTPYAKQEIANWDGRTATLLAIEGLRQLKARKAVPVLLSLLRHFDAEVVSKAIESLGDLGDQSVIPELLPFLGNEFFSDVATNSLHKLGADDLVELFGKALNRDKTAVDAVRRHPFRKGFVAGFIRLLWSWNDISPIPDAAWVLAELLAFEAIPSLQAQVSRWLPTEIRQACQQALNKLEMISRLPTPASPTEIDTSVLPRPATTTEIPVDTLPRDASGD